MTVDMMRERFETWHTAELRRVRPAGTAVDDNGSDNVFWRNERGDCGVDSIHAAWIGWFHGWMDHRGGYGR